MFMIDLIKFMQRHPVNKEMEMVAHAILNILL